MLSFYYKPHHERGNQQMATDKQQDILRIAQQEQKLQFEAFDKASAWELGQRLKVTCEKAAMATTIEIRLARETVFLYAMPGTAASNADWARRKRNVVELMGKSSYAVGLSCEEEGQSLEALMGLPTRQYACHGGSFPIKVKGADCVGVVTVSGLPQREDHIIVVQVLAQMCGIDPSEVEL
jgi:uncharacterized protein (UPF0303 family)